MEENQILIQELELELDRIREEHRKKTGIRSVTIMTRDSVEKIAEMKSANLEEVSALVKIGDRDLREEYARRICAVLRKHLEVPETEETEVSASKTDLSGVMSKLSGKLTDMSKMNPLLRKTKLGKYDMDISDIGTGIISRTFSVSVCDRIKSPEESERYDRLTAIDHNSRSKRRDSGQNSLYIAYPFVTGNVKGSDFAVMAPLMLTPVVIVRESTRIILKNDPSRDSIYNENLVIFHLTKTGSSKSYWDTDKSKIVADSLSPGERYDADSIRTAISRYYKGFEMDIVFDGMDPVPFTEYQSDDLDEAATDTLRVIPNMVLGTFDSPDGSIQRDFGKIISKGKVPAVIAELLKNTNMEDFYGESGKPAASGDVSESDILYINSLNSAQENIIKAIDSEDAIVIQGPPGTGKSQTISDIIITRVARGEHVLVVSEKKAALDVIKSRLGPLNNMALILPDSQDKDSFYKQIESAIDFRSSAKMTDVSGIDREIDSDIRKLSKIDEAVYGPMPVLDVEPYRIYALGRRFDLLDAESRRKYDGIISKTPAGVFSQNFETLSAGYREMKGSNLRRVVFDYLTIEKLYPWTLSVKNCLSEEDIVRMVSEAKDIRQKEEEPAKGLLGKLKNRRENASERSAFSRKYLVKGSDPSGIIDSPDLDDMAAVYERFRITGEAFNALAEETRDYGRAVFGAAGGNFSGCDAGNEDAYYAVLCRHLMYFEASNPGLHGLMQSFESIADSIEDRTSKKTAAVRSNMECILRENLADLGPSEQDIRLVLDKKQNRYSVTKFIERIPLMSAFKVWLMTPNSVSDILPLAEGMFDVVIFDEASQMYLERSIPSIYRGRKVVIAGDHRQLRPSSLGFSRIIYSGDGDDIDDDTDTALEQESLLDLARFRYRNYVLKFHYRSKYEELIAFSNSAFYKGELFISPNIESPSSPPIEYHNVRGVWESQRNTAEAEAIVSSIKDILRNRRENESVGVITFNSVQRDWIIDLIEKERVNDPDFDRLMIKESSRSDNGEDMSIFVKNIENVQGEERDIIMFSVGYARGPDGRMNQRFGWLNQAGGENRLNVAITRARKKIHIFASLEPPEFEAEATKNPGPKILKQYLAYAKAISERDETSAKLILENVSECSGVHDASSRSAVEELGAYLALRGYNLRYNVGISGYNIDLAVYDDEKFIIGIEADSNIYPAMHSTRERDIHRSRYLSGRGWKVCRFWIAEYWKNRDAEFERILRKIEDTAAMANNN